MSEAQNGGNVMERLTYWNEEYGCWSYHCGSGEAANRLAAYEDTVVRCEDCAFSQSDGWVCGGTALMPQHRTFPDSFCSEGERKDGGDG